MTTNPNIQKILLAAVKRGASDTHLKAGVPPTYRIRRELTLDQDFPVCTAEDTRQYLKDLTTIEQFQHFAKNLELDFAYDIPEIGRFRVNAYQQLGTVALVFRWVKSEVPNLDLLGLPAICQEMALKRDGLVILTGPTGCGKSTTLAAMLNFMNYKTKRNIITVEDPVEFVHHDHKCTFSQREVGLDTVSFASALKHVMRQDPDVILVGEMRDLETMSIALTAAETGHLVLTTLHTPSAHEAIDRFVDAFPPYQHTQVRLQLSTTLLGIIYQNLVPKADKTGVIPIVEVLIATPAIRNLIREGKTYQMTNFMQTGQNVGMQTLDQSLIDLYRQKKITYDDAACRIQSEDSLARLR
jgi:twitching motility protein PilT